MSVSLLLDIGSTALNAQRIAIDVTGENITNVNTPGYSRQTAVLESQIPTVVNGLPTGAGVKVTTVQRAYDSFLQNQLIAANASNGNATASNSALQMVQPLFNDLTGNGLGSSLQSFFSAWQDLTANPQGVPERQAILAKGQQLVDQFHLLNQKLVDVKDNQNSSLVGITTDINDKLNQIATLNTRVKQIEALGSQANEMRDQRDLLVRDLSRLVGVNATEETDGTVTITLTHGETLVSENKAGAFSLQSDAGNSGYYDVLLSPADGSPTVDTTSFVGGTSNQLGSIGATLQTRDTVVNQFQSSLDELATTLAAQVNAVHSAGYGLNSSTGVNFFNNATSAGGLALSISSPSDIAAADADPASSGTGNNKIAQSIASIYDTQYAMTGGNMTMGDYFTALVGRVGVAVQNADRSDTQTKSTLTQLNNMRESNAGVSLDEELVNLTKYQEAYQGAAKMINVGTTMLDAIINMVQ